MGKDKRSQTKRCLRCTQRAEYESELCADCEQDALDALGSKKTTVTHGYHVDISFEPIRQYETRISGTWIHHIDYSDPLDQERADSMVGGE